MQSAKSNFPNNFPIYDSRAVEAPTPCLVVQKTTAARIVLLVVIIGHFGVAFASQGQISEAQAIRAIVGEASGEGYVGMVAVAEAIRNRGHLRGVYGIKSPHVDKEPKWVFDRARKAWRESEKSNLVKKADHWENTKAFGEPYWAKGMTKTATIGSHTFYRSK